MNSEEFIDRLYKCTTKKEFNTLKKAIEVELDTLNGKNTDITPKMEEYIKNNYNKVITLIFVEPNEEFEGKLAGKMMFKRANSLEKHLKCPMGSFFHTWNGIKEERYNNYKEQINEHIEMLNDMGSKKYKEQIKRFEEKNKQIKEIAW